MIQPDKIAEYFKDKRIFDEEGWTGEYKVTSKDILDFIIDNSVNADLKAIKEGLNDIEWIDKQTAQIFEGDIDTAGRCANTVAEKYADNYVNQMYGKEIAGVTQIAKEIAYGHFKAGLEYTKQKEGEEPKCDEFVKASNQQIREAFKSTDGHSKPYSTTDGYINTLKSNLREQGLYIVKKV